MCLITSSPVRVSITQSAPRVSHHLVLELHLNTYRGGKKRCSLCLNMPKFSVFKVFTTQVGKVLYMILHDATFCHMAIKKNGTSVLAKSKAEAKGCVFKGTSSRTTGVKFTLQAATWRSSSLLRPAADLK